MTNGPCWCGKKGGGYTFLQTGIGAMACCRSPNNPPHRLLNDPKLADKAASVIKAASSAIARRIVTTAGGAVPAACRGSAWSPPGARRSVVTVVIPKKN